MIDIVLYYAFYASAVLFYGIGLERAAVLSVAFDKSVFRPALRCGVSALTATFVTELIAVHILFPLGLTELYPLAALLVFAAVLSGTGLFVRTPSLMQTGEYAASYLIVLLSLLYLGVKNIHVGPTLPAFLSPNVLNVLVKNFGLATIGTVDDDLKLFLGE